MSRGHILSQLLAAVCWTGGLAEAAGLSTASADSGMPSHAYDVVWDRPSRDHHGSMPLGNGDIGINAWIEPSGELVFYISKTDAWDDNGRLVKVGRVRMTLDPAPMVEPFVQQLRLGEGTLEAVFGDGASAITLRLWVDAHRPVIHVETEGRRAHSATAGIELWRTEPRPLSSLQVSDLMEDRSQPGSLHQPVVVQPDTVVPGRPGRIGWYHHNHRSEGPSMIAAIQGLDGLDRVDPLLHRTFGGMIQIENGVPIDDTQLQSGSATRHRFSIHVLTRFPATPGQWLEAMEQEMAATAETSFNRRRQDHLAWWAAFWDRSHIHVTSNRPATPASLVPANDHPIRFGMDQQGGNRFGGALGRVSLVPRALPPTDIRALADRRQVPAFDSVEPGFSGTPEPGDVVPGLTASAFVHGLTLEAWIKEPDGGRIVDHITPGGSDGFLFDTHPGHALRLIVGDHTLTVPDTLPGDRWVHVAAVVDPAAGRIALYQDGALLDATDIERANDALVVSRGYALQRYLDACAGRGRYPIKFNGSIFTVPEAGDPDFRRWGPGYWWQNTRLPYISMCTAGDLDLIKPLFRMYVSELMPVHRFRTRLQTGHGGAFIPECMYFWGDQFTSTYGWTPLAEREDKLQESGWHKWEWVSGLELAFMMLDYYDHSLDESFLTRTLLPAAGEFLAFFDQHYPIDDQGQWVMHPSMACETWWDCTNPMPEVAGLHAVTARLLALPRHLTTPRQRQEWSRLRQRIPPLPLRTVEEGPAFAPATRFADKRNVENPELYAVFPFRLAAVEMPNVELGRRALAHRWDRGHSGWRQDDLFMAYLGLARDAQAQLTARARTRHARSRFPAFWGPNYDWVPDQDHGGVLTRTLQAMLLQSDPYSRKIILLPAWPADWDADFKLHAPYQTVIEGRVERGELVEWSVSPPSRRNDVLVMPAQEPPPSATHTPNRSPS